MHEFIAERSIEFASHIRLRRLTARTLSFSAAEFDVIVCRINASR